MIEIYSPDNTDFEHNGDMTLLPVSASVHVILNSTWEAELTHPIDDEGRWEYIMDEAVVKMPSFNGPQLFRIKQKEKSDSGITVTMEPIFMDSMDDCFLVDVRPTGKNGQEALDLMTAPNKKYKGISNIKTSATAYYEYVNLIEAINGDNENSFVNRWGGEILFDNYTVRIDDKVGEDRGVQLRYGKNIPQDGLKEDVDIRDVVTRIYPKAYNGYKMTGTGYVDSPLINNYPTIKTATITFDDVKMEADAQEDDAENGVIICKNQTELNAALEKRCQEQYEAGIDKPKVTISADMVLLADTEQYKEFAVLETVSLGDTIHCYHRRLGITTDVRVIELEYDSVRKKVSSVVLGDFAYNYFNDVSSSINRIDSVIRPDGTVMADKIKGFIDGAMASLRAQYDIANKQDVMAILFENLDEDSLYYGASAIGTQGISISKKRTADGKEWDWTTAMTAAGMIADVIVAGIISDKEGKSYWDLDNGDMQMTGDFIQLATNGKKAVDIIDNALHFYDYNNNSKRILWLVGYPGTEYYKAGANINFDEDTAGVSINSMGKSTSKQVMNIEKYGTTIFVDLNMAGNDITNQSDIRIKDNIQPIGKGELEKLMKLPIVSFDYLTNEKHDEAGVIAQTLEPLFPGCVTEDGEGVKQVVPIRLLYHTIKAVQELNDKVDKTETLQELTESYTKEEKLAFVEELKRKEREKAERRLKGEQYTS